MTDVDLRYVPLFPPAPSAVRDLSPFQPWPCNKVKKIASGGPAARISFPEADAVMIVVGP